MDYKHILKTQSLTFVLISAMTYSSQCVFDRRYYIHLTLYFLCIRYDVLKPYQAKTMAHESV